MCIKRKSIKNDLFGFLVYFVFSFIFTGLITLILLGRIHEWRKELTNSSYYLLSFIYALYCGLIFGYFREDCVNKKTLIGFLCIVGSLILAFVFCAIHFK
jgi:hypothetical protein